MRRRVMRRWIDAAKNVSYKRKLFIYSILLSLLPVCTLGMISAHIASVNIQEEVNSNHRLIMNQLEIQVDAFLREMDKASLQLANDQYLQKSMATGLSMDHLQTTLSVMDSIQKTIQNAEVDFEVTVYYSGFTQMYSSRYGIVRELAEPYHDIVLMTRGRHDRATIVSPNTYKNMPQLLVIRSLPLHSLNPKGYLILQLDIGKLTRFIKQLDPDGDRKILIVDHQGNILTGGDVFQTGAALDPLSPFYPDLADAPTQEFVELDNVRYKVSTLKSSVNDWVYIVMTPGNELTYRADNIRKVTWGIILLLSVLWGALAFIGSRRLYFPIGRLVQTNAALQSRLIESETYRKESVLLQLLRGELANQEIGKITEESRLLPKGDRFCVCVIDIDQFAYFQETFKDKDRSLMMYALRNLIDETCSSLESVVTVTPKLGQIVLIIGLHTTDREILSSIAKVSENIRTNVHEYFDFTVSAAISNVREQHSGICEAYQEALDLLGFRWIVGPNKNITIADAEPSLVRSSYDLIQWKTAILHSIAQENFDAAREQLAQLVEAIPRALHYSEGILGLFISLLGEIDVVLRKLGYELRDMFEYDVFDHLCHLSFLQEVRHWMADIVFTAIDNHLKSHHASKWKRIVPQAQQYIQEHYETDLSLQILSDHFNVSPSMLSLKFKEETGMNYINYVIQFRVNKAKEWLIHTEMPIKDISDKLRYTTLQNFNRIFKQVTGVSPGNYRKVHRGEPLIKKDHCCETQTAR